MLVALLVFLAVFFCRDVQLLALDAAAFRWRFTLYVCLLAPTIPLLASTAGNLLVTRPPASLAWLAVVIQISEMIAAIALEKWSAGRYRWVGWLLPSPAFLAALLGAGLTLQRVTGITTAAAVLMAAMFWTTLVGSLAFLLSRIQHSAEDRRFVTDLALFTGCTVLVFVPLAFY
jgi:hypothetical protein